MPVNYSCAKCNEDCLENCPKSGESIFCDICTKWLHVKCSGLTYKRFKILSGNIEVDWFCQNYIKSTFPFGHMGETTFRELLKNSKNDGIKEDLINFINKNNFTKKCPSCSKNTIKGAIPCSICNKLFHQKCAKLNLRNFKNIESLKLWSCSNCRHEIFPFQDIANNDLNVTNLTNNKQLKTKNDITKLRQ